MSKEAMRLALEALEHMLEDAKQERLTVEYWNECVDAITALREALAEQPAQQEPVAFLDWYDNAHWGNEDFKDGCWRAWDAALEHTSPPTLSLAQRTWVGLTDEEIVRIVSLAGFAPDWVEAHIATQIVRVLEAKLKEKNT